MIALAPTAEDRAQAQWALALEDFPTFLTKVRIAETIVKEGRELIADAAGAIQFELWPHLLRRARAWQSRKYHEIILKARQLGLSWLAAAYALWTALRQASAKVLLISDTQDDAEELMRKVQFIYEHLDVPAWVKPAFLKWNTEELVISGGGHILCVPSTERGGRGFTATLIICDENAWHLHALANFAAYSPAALDGGQMIILSTANGTTGFFHDQFVAAQVELEAWRHEQGPAPIFRPVFIGALDRPDRDAAWYDRARRTYPGLPQLFKQEYPLSADEAFVQLLGLVFPQFDQETHVREFDPMPWEQCLYRWLAYDLGGGDPTAIGAFGVYRDSGGQFRVHLYGHYYKRFGAPTVDEMAAWMFQWIRPNAPVTFCEADPKDATVEASLRALNIPAHKGDWARFEGLGNHAMFLDQGWFTIRKDALDVIREYVSYRWLTRTDPNDKSRYATATPHDHHGDMMDVIRLALLGIYTRLMSARTGKPAYAEVRL